MIQTVTCQPLFLLHSSKEASITSIPAVLTWSQPILPITIHHRGRGDIAGGDGGRGPVRLRPDGPPGELARGLPRHSEGGRLVSGWWAILSKRVVIVKWKHHNNKFEIADHNRMSSRRWILTVMERWVMHFYPKFEESHQIDDSQLVERRKNLNYLCGFEKTINFSLIRGTGEWRKGQR